ncbi:MAG: hypothetical protein IJD22_00845 [Clostridia bacterium]|nr:hypothetical protein [Clostridia bacterium]
MPNKTIDANAFCPFYVKEGVMSITCEGIIGASTVSKFNTEHDKLYHETNFCTGKTCRGCSVYTALMGKYMPPIPNKAASLRH